jgi:hypothetical protein
MRTFAMKHLLDNQYAPTTFCLGFVEAPFRTVVDAFVQWMDRVFNDFELEYEVVSQSGGLVELLESLFPVRSPTDRQMLIETRSSWTAYFDNGAIGSDPYSAVGQLCDLLKCRGVALSCIPHNEPEIERGVYGAVQFQLFAPHRTDVINHGRNVSLTHGDDH